MINKVIALTVVLFLFTSVVLAHPYGKPNQQHTSQQHRKGLLQRLSKQLELTHAQKLQFKVILKEQRKSRVAGIKKHRTETDNRLNSVLTAAQQEKFAANKERHKQRRKEGCRSRSQ